METASREKQVHNSISQLEKALNELSNTAESLVASAGKVLSPPTPTKTGDLVGAPKQQKADLAIKVDDLVDVARRITAVLLDATARLEV
jgi:hypothetical protein